MSALHKIGYGLYIVTVKDESKDNALIVNTVMQVADDKVAVSVNKANHSHDMIKSSGKLNVNCLSVNAPFSVFEKYGFKSGRDTDKFAEGVVYRTENGLAGITEYINAVLCLEVSDTVDLGSHTMFICKVTDSFVVNDEESMTYSYYHKNVKPKAPKKAKGYVCKICNYVYEGNSIPADYVCPICKHPAGDFEVIG